MSDPIHLREISQSTLVYFKFIFYFNSHFYTSIVIVTYEPFAFTPRERGKYSHFATPFGLYQYCRLSMGMSESSDIATKMMHSVLDSIEGIEFYMYDIGIFSLTWTTHLSLLTTVLTRLQDVGFTIYPLKCEWAIQETDFLGHWLMPTGIKPWQKKVDAILHLQPPTNIKQLRSFLSMVNHYWDMWPRQTHVLVPLTELTRKCSFHWTSECQLAFEKMKTLVSSDALLAFPDHTQPFVVKTNASDYQLGSVIQQQGCPIASYSRKLNSAQHNYTTLEKELLSIIETFKEFWTILLGSTIQVHTDHKNLTDRLMGFTTQQVLHWRLLLEEPSSISPDPITFSPTLSLVSQRLATKGRARLLPSTYGIVSLFISFMWNSLLTNRSWRYARLTAPLVVLQAKRPQDRLTVAQQDLFLEHPVFDAKGRLPFQYKTLNEYQQDDPQLQPLPTTNPQQYHVENMRGYELVCSNITISV